MTKRFVLATAAALALGAAALAQSQTSNPWNIGDVFMGDGDLAGTYRVFAPDGTQKTDPDLVDNTGQFATGCAVDPNVADGDLFTTSWYTPVTQFSGSVPHQVLNTFDVASAPLANGVSLPAEFLTPADPTSWGAIESVVFDTAGDMYLGAQVVPQSATTWPGHGWIIKMSKAGEILAWWQVDAGEDEYVAGTAQLVHGVDWMDLSSDQKTIYYTSEDGYIRSFNVVTGTQGTPIPIHGNDGQLIANQAFALRILPPGDPSNGFLVATSDLGISRVDGNGLILRRYFDPGAVGYFTLDITPDGGSFWTTTFDGALYRFHIASGSMSGPFQTNMTSASGLCVKHEYTAAQNVCYATDLNGNAIPDGSGGYVTQVCKLPPTPAYCEGHPSDPDCVAPGTPALSLLNQTNRDADQVSVQLQATDPVGQGLTWQVTGLPPGMDAAGNDQPLKVDKSTGQITGTIKYHDSAMSPYSVTVTVTNARGQAATGRFLWTITNGNAPPSLTYTGGPRTVTVGFPFNPPIVMAGNDLDLDTLFLTASYQEYSDATFTTPVGSLQSGLPIGMALPVDQFGRTAAASCNNCSIVLAGQPAEHSTVFPQFFKITVGACDCDANWDQSDPTLVVLHHVSQSVNLTITDQKPTFTVSNQLNVTGTALMYSQMNTSANDPDGANHLPVTFAVVSGVLPPALALQPDTSQGNLLTGVVAGTPSQAGTYPITVRGSDKYGAFLDQSFTWDIVAAPVDQATLVNTPASYTLPSLPNGHAATYTVTGLPAGLTASGGVISGTPTTPSTGGPSLVTVTTTDTVSSLKVTSTFHWTINAPPLITVGNQTTVINTSVSYQIQATSPNGDAMSYAITGLPAGLSASASGLVTGAPSAVVNAAPVSVTITDTVNNLTASGNFTWTVIAPPTFTVSNQATLVGTPVSLSIGASSPNGDGVTYAITGLPAGLTANLSTGVISGAPTTPTAGATVTVAVTGTTTHLTTTKTFVWRVFAPPLVTAANQVTLLNAPVSYQIPATPQPAGDVLTYAVSGLPTGLSANPATGLVTGTPTVAANGQLVTVTVTDTTATAALGTSIATTTTFTWSVITNRAPVCSAATAAPMLIWPPNHKFVPIVIGGVIDPDGDPIALTITSITQDQPVNSTGDGNTPSDGAGVGTSQASVRAERTGNLVVPDDGRLYQINFTAADGKGGTCAGAVYTGVPHDQGQHSLPTDNGCRWDSVTGQQIGACAWLHAPDLDLSDLTNYEADAISLQLSAVDPDGTPLTYTVTSGALPPGLALTPSGLISGSVAHGAGGTSSRKYAVTVTVTDGFNPTAASFTWTIKPRPNHVVLTDVPDQTNFETDTIALQLSAVGPVGSTLNFQVTGGALPPGLTVTPSGLISGKIAAGAGASSSRRYSITVTVSDGHSSDSDTFVWTVKTLRGTGHYDGDGCGAQHHDGDHYQGDGHNHPGGDGHGGDDDHGGGGRGGLS